LETHFKKLLSEAAQNKSVLKENESEEEKEEFA
jgi:hypothetical protein